MEPFFPGSFVSNMSGSSKSHAHRREITGNAMEEGPLRKIFFFLLITGWLAGCGSRGNGVDLIIPANRTAAPEIQADFLNSSGSALTLGQLKGKVVVLDFWATWCGPCRMELPSLVKIYNTYHGKGLEVIGLSVELNDGQSKDYFRQFMGNYAMNYPVGLAGTDTLKNYGINPIPATFFIDKKGKVALSFVGVHPEDQFIGAIEQLLAE